MSPWPQDNELLLDRYAYVCAQLRAAQNAGNRADIARWQAEKESIVELFDQVVESRQGWRVLAMIMVFGMVAVGALVMA